jgi:hypothetical protein
MVAESGTATTLVGDASSVLANDTDAEKFYRRVIPGLVTEL